MASLLYNLGFIATYVFILTSMLHTGLMVTIGDLVAPLHNRRLLTLSLFANFIIVPLIAITLILLIPMNPQLAAGLLLVSIAAGAPSTAKVAQITRGNVAQAVSLTIIMTIITIVLMPFLIPFILEGAQTDPLYIMGNLVVMILIPILIGIIIKNRSESFAARLEPVMDYVSDISIAVIFLTLGIIFLSQLGEIVSTGSGALAVFVAIVFTLASIGITYLIGYLEKDSRRNLALGAGFRNITAVLVVIFASFTNLKKDARVAVFSSFTNIQNDALLMVLMVTVFSIIIVSILVGIIYKKRRRAEKKKLLG
ncbi:MAG: bile acid:sodium symporter [Methanoregula sp.]|nr:bile acid:sodium symporter [Methanoregula sp.]